MCQDVSDGATGDNILHHCDGTEVVCHHCGGNHYPNKCYKKKKTPDATKDTEGTANATIDDSASVKSPHPSNIITGASYSTTADSDWDKGWNQTVDNSNVANSFLNGRDEYPKTLVAAYKLVTN